MAEGQGHEQHEHHPVNGLHAVVDLADPRQQWRERAACRGSAVAIFFPERDDADATAPARAVCAECPVSAQCLADALDRNEEYGIWGGATPRERRVTRRRSRRPA